MDISESQSLLMETLTQWNHYIARPFKQLLDEGMSPPMCHCIDLLRHSGQALTMTELGKWLRMPKQQVTKLADRLIERGLAERVSDPKDRRKTRLQITPAANEYMAGFKQRQMDYYTEMLLKMSEDDRSRFNEAIKSLHEVFGHMTEAGLGNDAEKER